MLMFALYLVLNEKKLLKQQLDEIFGMLFGERRHRAAITSHPTRITSSFLHHNHGRRWCGDSSEWASVLSSPPTHPVTQPFTRQKRAPPSFQAAATPSC